MFPLLSFFGVFIGVRGRMPRVGKRALISESMLASADFDPFSSRQLPALCAHSSNLEASNRNESNDEPRWMS